MRVVLDLDDYSDAAGVVLELERLNDHFDNFKVNMFTIPELTSLETLQRGLSLGCTFYQHGFNHAMLELDSISREEMLVKLGEPLSDLYNRTVFKAPYWRYSSASIEVLVENDYVIAVPREDSVIEYILRVRPDAVLYHYHAELDEEYGTEPYLRLHGHTTPYRNDLTTNIDQLMDRLPKDTVFMTIEEALSWEEENLQ